MDIWRLVEVVYSLFLFTKSLHNIFEEIFHFYYSKISYILTDMYDIKILGDLHIFGVGVKVNAF